jgi:non-specific serine/threonine protein kinase
LVLDNCEHLLEACARLADHLLRTAPRLTLLATSREPLRLAGEAIVPVLHLPFPPADQAPTPAGLAPYAVVHLFSDRARLAQPAYELSARNAAPVALICRRLDGIPLAIELAAARLSALSVEQIAARLDDRFRVLTGGDRSALERQQTLRATIDWSYHLLTHAERALLQRLAVFAGGWTLEAAESVTSDAPDWDMLARRASGGLEPANRPSQPHTITDVLDTLTHLVNKSLVLLEADSGRYRVLETIREYARERLEGSGEDRHWRDRHLTYYVRLAVEAEPKLHGPEQLTWLNRLESELDNVRAALGWALGSGQAESAMRLAGALWLFWVRYGYVHEGHAWLKQALAADGSASPAVRAQTMIRAGMASRWLGDWPGGKVLLEQALAQCRALGDRPGMALALLGLGIVSLRLKHDPTAARPLFEESLALFQEVGNLWGTAWNLDWLRRVDVYQGDFTTTRRLGEESVKLMRQIGDKWDLALVLHNLAQTARFQGEYGRAKVLYEEGTGLERQLGMERDYRARRRAGLGYVMLRMGQPDSARRFFREGLALNVENGVVGGAVVQNIAGLAGVAAAQGRMMRAAHLLGAAEALLETWEGYIDPQDRAERDRDVTLVREALDNEAFTAAWIKGRSMTMDQVIAFAMESHCDGEFGR